MNASPHNACSTAGQRRMKRRNGPSIMAQKNAATKAAIAYFNGWGIPQHRTKGRIDQWE